MEVFLGIYLNSFCEKSSIVDVLVRFKYASEFEWSNKIFLINTEKNWQSFIDFWKEANRN